MTVLYAWILVPMFFRQEESYDIRIRSMCLGRSEKQFGGAPSFDPYQRSLKTPNTAGGENGDLHRL